MIVIWQLKEGTFALTELDGSVWQNKIVAFRVIPYLVHRKIAFGDRVKALLGALELYIKELEKSSVEKVSKESSFENGLE